MRGSRRRLGLTPANARQSRRLLGASLAAVTVVVAVCVAPAGADVCPNEQLRTEDRSASLPDCRAYEQVSPTEKNGAEITSSLTQASTMDGEVVFGAVGAFGESVGSTPVDTYLSSRGASGWATEGITPLSAPSPGTNSSSYGEFSPDLSSGFVEVENALNPEDPKDYRNLYRRDNATGRYTLLSPQEAGPFATPFYEPIVYGSTANDRTVMFGSLAKLSPEATEGVATVYTDDGGQLTVQSILPGGEYAAEGATIGSVENGGGASSGGLFPHAISDDGSRVFFTTQMPSGASATAGQLYLREGGAQTTEVSAPQRAGGDPNGPQFALFWSASADGSRAFFTSKGELTENANTGPAGEGDDLYAYEAGNGVLTDISADTNDSAGGQVVGVVGSSEDGSYVYFVARGALAAGAVAGSPNLYVWHEGHRPALIAVLSPSDLAEPSANGYVFTNTGEVTVSSNNVNTEKSSRLTANGEHLVFVSTARLTSYDNGGHREVYEYNAPSAALQCVSCNYRVPQATGQASLHTLTAQVTPGTDHLSRNVSEDGAMVFFETTEALVPQDTNGTTDVYEFEDGQARLLSSGSSPSPSEFADATPSGDEVFITTAQQLVGEDEDGLADLYDVRIDGGFPAPIVPVAPCVGEDCLGPPEAVRTIAVPSSTAVTGAGNLASVPASKPIPKPLTKAQKLAIALKPCRKMKQRKKRAKCEAQARKRFGARNGTRASKARSRGKTTSEGGRR